jgi:hypothetical protein
VQGDYNYSGGVTLTDISLLNNSGLYGKGSYLPVAGLGALGDGGALALGSPDTGLPVLATVPEPDGAVLAVVGAALAAVTCLGARGSTSRRRLPRIPATLTIPGREPIVLRGSGSSARGGV